MPRDLGVEWGILSRTGMMVGRCLDFYAAKAKLAKVMYKTSMRCWLGLLVATGTVM